VIGVGNNTNGLTAGFAIVLASSRLWIGGIVATVFNIIHQNGHSRFKDIKTVGDERQSGVGRVMGVPDMWCHAYRQE